MKIIKLLSKVKVDIGYLGFKAKKLPRMNENNINLFVILLDLTKKMNELIF